MPENYQAPGAADALRLDKWFWHARFFKSRSLATRFCQSGKLRVDGTVIRKAHHTIHVSNVLTFPKGPDIRVIKVLDTGARRGPAAEAQDLYDDLNPPEVSARKAGKLAAAAASTGCRKPGAGRPTKADRRAIDRLRAWIGLSRR